MHAIRGTYRFLRLIFFTFGTLIKVLLIQWFKGKNLQRGMQMRCKWAQGLMRILAYEPQFEGTVPEGTFLFVGNHRSSLDPIVILSQVLAFPVSRADVEHWPMVGKGATLTGTLYVEKSSKESRKKTKENLLKVLQDGNSILLFPEGRTNIEKTTIRFRKGSFEQASKGNFPVVPFALEYKDTRDYWDHSNSFVVHLIKTFGKPKTPIRIIFGDPIISEDPWLLLNKCQRWIDSKILEMRNDWDYN
jgi:1-acyl-sn-glycerol-3-phosphate acyltransferase